MTKVKNLMRFYEMAINLEPKETELPISIWCPQDTQVRVKHPSAYLKVSISGTNNDVSVSIEQEPKFRRSIKGIRKGDLLSGRVYGQVKKFIQLNLDVLIKHWKKEITDTELGNRIKRVS